MEVARSSETMEQTYYPMQCNNPEDNRMHQGYPALTLIAFWDVTPCNVLDMYEC
jgi:hypothetical protein